MLHLPESVHPKKVYIYHIYPMLLLVELYIYPRWVIYIYYTEKVRNLPSLGGFLRYICSKALKFEKFVTEPAKHLVGENV